MGKENQENIYDNLERGWGEIPPPDVPVISIIETDTIVNGNLKKASREKNVREFINSIRRRGKYVGISRRISGGLIVIAGSVRGSLGSPEIHFSPLKPRTAK